jgi:hypothetical protein
MKETTTPTWDAQGAGAGADAGGKGFAPGIEGGAISDLGGGVLFGMPARYNKGQPLR